MASGEFNNASLSSDEEEEIFAGFTVEEVSELRQRRQRQLEQICVKMLRSLWT